MWGMAAPMALYGQGRDISFSKRDIPPFDPPRENCIAGLQLEGVRRLGNGSALRGGIASLAAIVVAIRFASAPIIRCRSADLAAVQPNHRLTTVSSMR